MNTNLKQLVRRGGQKIAEYHKQIFAEMYQQYVGVHLNVTDKFGGRWKYFLFLLERMKVVRSHIAVPFLLAELAFWMTFVIHMMNFGSVTKYVGQFIPKGAWWFIIPLWIVALEILWSRKYRNWHLRHEAYYFALYRYGPDSPRSMLVTIIIRLIKGSFMMGYLYVVMYGTDVRLGNIFWETVLQLWPLGALTAGLFVFQAIYGYLLFGNSWDWQKKGVLLAVVVSVFGAYYKQFKLFVPNFHMPAINTPSWNWSNQPAVTTFELKDLFLGFLVAISLLIVTIALGLLVNKVKNVLEDDTNLDFIRDGILSMWWVTPIIYFGLLISIVSFRWYHEIYIPDRMAAEQAAAIAQTIESSATPAPAFTLTPPFTATSILPTETLTAIPETLTATPASFTATSSPTLAFTSTLTDTPVASTATTASGTLNGLSWTSVYTEATYDANGVSTYQSVASVQNGELYIISNSKTKIGSGEFTDAIQTLEPIGSYKGCTVAITGVTTFDWDKCFVYHIENKWFKAPRLINNWLFSVTSGQGENLVYYNTAFK
ncbi:hypothetical protein KBC80_03675 [Candidatus Woesebacteria bacterium]|nr:hypothetical protein [Candidatus Woesebacteria bacterium]